MPSSQNLLQRLGVGRVVPRAGAVPLPFLLRAQHRLVMRGAHDDAVLVGELGVQRIVFVEGVVPHRRPEVVGLQPQQQFEDFRIELVVVVSVLLLHPAGERGSLVVEKDAAIFHRRAGLVRTRRPSRTARLGAEQERRPTSTRARRQSAPRHRRCRRSCRACRCLQSPTRWQRRAEDWARLESGTIPTCLRRRRR